MQKSRDAILGRSARVRRALLGFLIQAVIGDVAFAREVPLLEVKSSYPSGYAGALLLELSEDSAPEELEAIVYRDSRRAELRYSPEELRKGAVLIHALGKELLMLRSPELDTRSGGEVQLVFYRKFFSEDRRELMFELKRNAHDGFMLETNDAAGRDPFDGVAIQLSTGFVPSGVERIEVFAQKQRVRRYDPRELPRVP